MNDKFKEYLNDLDRAQFNAVYNFSNIIEKPQAGEIAPTSALDKSDLIGFFNEFTLAANIKPEKSAVVTDIQNQFTALVRDYGVSLVAKLLREISARQGFVALSKLHYYPDEGYSYLGALYDLIEDIPKPDSINEDSELW